MAISGTWMKLSKVWEIANITQSLRCFPEIHLALDPAAAVAVNSATK